MSKKIIGIAKYIDLGTGFWGIEDSHGNKWQPINMPEQLKYDGKKVHLSVQEVDVFTNQMWGTVVKIISFRTVSP